MLRTSPLPKTNPQGVPFLRKLNSTKPIMQVRVLHPAHSCHQGPAWAHATVRRRRQRTCGGSLYKQSLVIVSTQQ